MRNPLPVAAVTLLLFATSVTAQVVAYDGFSYPAGQGLNGQNGGSGFASSWTVPASTVQVWAGSSVPAAPSSGLTETGNSLILTPQTADGGAIATRNLSTPVLGTPGTAAWVSVVMKGNGQSATSAEAELDLYSGPSLVFGMSSGTTGGVGVPASSNWSLIPDSGTNSSSKVSNALQSLLVARITFGASNDAVDLFVNPPVGGGPPATADASIAIPHVTSISQLQVIFFDIDAPANSAFFDEVRLGRTFAAVTPSTVPEPSTLMLIGSLGLGGLLARRRRLPDA
jgi:hypothetical protein